jgi:uncharacterized membrane protein YcaP (DUF421 family)
MSALAGLFGGHPPLTPSQECARAVLIFAFGLAMVRIAGRRIFGKWSALDTIVSVMVGSNLSRAITGSAPLWGTLAATSLLFALHWVLAKATIYSPLASRLLEGAPKVLAEAGRADPKARRRDSVSDADLGEAVRAAGLERHEQARRITLEPSGRITVLKS